MKALNFFFACGALLLCACSQEEAHPTLVADFELATPQLIIGEPLQIAEVTPAGVQYSWDFGNGKTSNDQFPVGIAYEQPGTYAVKVTIRSVGGSETSAQKDIIVGQHHAYRVELQQILDAFHNRDDMDIYFTASQINPLNDENERVEELIYQSEVLERVNHNNLPITWEVENLPLGSQGNFIADDTRIRFYDQNSGELIAVAGDYPSIGNLQKYDPVSQEGEITYHQMGESSRAKLLFRPVFPNLLEQLN